MYFDDLYNNYEKNIDSFFIQNNIRKVDKLYELKKNTYRFNILNDHEKSYIIKHDLNSFLSIIFGFSEIITKAIKKEISLINDLMASKEDSLDFSDTFADRDTVLIKKSVNTFNEEEIELTFIRFKMVLSITASYVVLYDSNHYIKPEATMIVVDTEQAIIEAIHSFNKTFANLVCVDTQKFNKSFFENINTRSTTDILNTRIKNDNFKFVEKNDIETLLYPVRLKERFSSIWIGDVDCVMISSKNPQLFIESIKKILFGKSYTNFVQAFNFYHNYKLMMNEQFMSTIKMEFEHKLAPLDTAVITISIGCKFEITISAPVTREKYTRNSVFQISEPDPATDERLALESDDLHELYGFIFNKCSLKITELLNKNATDLEWRDVQVLRMINI